MNTTRKYKTQLCRDFMNRNFCARGDKCLFAHGESELRGKTLGERRDAGMVGGDVRTFRARPCFDHVATGSCPFGPKCNGIHDQRLEGSSKCWLRCNQFDLHDNWDWEATFYTDGSRDTKQAQINHSEPFGPHTDEMLSSYSSFKAAISNSSSDDTLSPVRKFQRVQMAKIMTNDTPRCTFSYSKPSHRIFGRVCLVRQERVFYVPNSETSSSSISVTELKNKYHLKKFLSAMNEQFPGPSPGSSSQDICSGSFVTAREISFGAPGSANAEEQPAIWFDIPEDAIEEIVDRSTILNKRLTRSERQSPILGADTSFYDLATDAMDSSLTPLWNPFYVYFSNREDTRQLIDGILSLRLLELFATVNDEKNICLAEDDDETILAQHNLFQTRFDAIKKDHLRWKWPMNEGRDGYSLDSPIPPVEGPYCIPANPSLEEGHTHGHLSSSLRAPQANQNMHDIWSSAHKNLRVVTSSSNEEEKLEEEEENDEFTNDDDDDKLDDNRTYRHYDLEIFATLARGEACTSNYTTGTTSENHFVPVRVPPAISSIADEPLFPRCFDQAWSKAREEYLSSTLS